MANRYRIGISRRVCPRPGLADTSRPRSLPHDPGDAHDLLQRIPRPAQAIRRHSGLIQPRSPISDTAQEEAALQAQIREIEQRAQLRGQRQSIEWQLRTVAEQTRTRLADPTPERLAQAFDILELDLTRVDSNVCEGSGSIPILENGTGNLLGEVHEETLRRPYPKLTGVTFGAQVRA